MISYEGMSPFSIGIRNTPQEGKPATIRLNVSVSNWKERLLPSPEEGKWAVHSIIDMNSGRENELGVVVYDMHITLTFIPEDLILRQGGKDQKGLIRMERNKRQYRLSATLADLDAHHMKKEVASALVKFPVLNRGTGKHYPVITLTLTGACRTNSRQPHRKPKGDHQTNSTFFDEG